MLLFVLLPHCYSPSPQIQDISAQAFELALYENEMYLQNRGGRRNGYC